MPRTLLAGLCALMLTGCASSETPILQPVIRAPIPKPPPTLAEECGDPPAPIVGEDGLMSRAETLASFNQLYQAYDLCRKRHRALVAAWPK